MSTVTIHLFGNTADANTLIALLQGLDDIESIGQVTSPAPCADNAGRLPADFAAGTAPGMHTFELVVSDQRRAERVLDAVGRAAVGMDAGVEFVDGH